MTKLFVGGLPYSINNQSLEDLFKPFGQVLSAQVITDKFTGQSKGFGFVEMADDAEAQKSISELNGSALEGRTLGVSVARPREDRPRDGGGNSRPGGGGFNNNRNSGGRGGFRDRR